MIAPDITSYNSLRHLMRAMHQSALRTNGEGYFEVFVSQDSFDRIRRSVPDMFRSMLTSDHSIRAFGIKVMVGHPAGAGPKAKE